MLSWMTMVIASPLGFAARQNIFSFKTRKNVIKALKYYKDIHYVILQISQVNETQTIRIIFQRKWQKITKQAVQIKLSYIGRQG